LASVTAVASEAAKAVAVSALAWVVTAILAKAKGVEAVDAAVTSKPASIEVLVVYVEAAS
jgi:hypothetical protein